MRLLLLLVLSMLSLCLFAAAAQAACQKSWVGGTGNWGTAEHWSPEGVPNSEQEVCIVAPGTYTVTIPANGGQAKTLTVGGSSGVQTIDVVGESWIYEGETQNVTALSVGSASFASNTRLILDASAAAGKGTEPKGAEAYLTGGSVEVAGALETLVSDPMWNDRIKVSHLKLKPGASLTDTSGTLRFLQEGEGGYPWQTTNEGTFTVDTGASVDMEPSFSGKAGFINDGSVLNSGSIALHGAEWTQQGGSVSGNPVVLQNGSSLIDSVGTGAFVSNYGVLNLTGTVPAGQSVKVVGAPFSYEGTTYYESGLSFDGKELVNDGTLALEAPGSGETGGSVNVEAGSVQNNGVIDSEASPSRRVQLLAAITNSFGATLDVGAGLLLDNEGAAVSNSGKLVIAPGAVYGLQENASLVNQASGVLSPQISGASSYGTIALYSPCCHGAGTLTAGGKLAPVLLGGYVPSKGQEFPLIALDGGAFDGTFARVGNGFSADYSHEGSGYVGAIYHLPSPPEFGRCVKVAAGTGEFKTAACDSTEAGGSYEWLAGVESAKAKFTASGGAATLATVSGTSVVCAGVSGSGEFNGTNEVLGGQLRFTGCEKLGHSCTSASAKEGELISSLLEGELGFEKAAKHKVALDLFPASISGPLLQFTCAGEAVSVSGSVLANIKADAKPSLTSSVTFKQSKGKQKPEAFEGGAKDVLLATFGGGSAQQAGLSLKLKLTGEEKIEVNATT